MTHSGFRLGTITNWWKQNANVPPQTARRVVTISQSIRVASGSMVEVLREMRCVARSLTALEVMGTGRWR